MIDRRLKRRARERRKQNVKGIILVVLIVAVLVALVVDAFIMARIIRERKENQQTEAPAETTVPEGSSDEEDTTAEPVTGEETNAPETLPPETTALPTRPTTTPNPTSPTSPTNPTTTPDPTVPTTAPRPVITGEGVRVWVGDSRTVAVQTYADYDRDKDYFIAATGEGRRWFASEGLSALEEALATGKVSKVYFNLGVNDCVLSYRWPEEYPAVEYYSALNRLIASYPRVAFYYLSVGYLDEEKYRGSSFSIPEVNEQVSKLNSDMNLYCAAEYVPLAEYLLSDGYTSWDGVHYDVATCRKIYQYVLSVTH